MKARRWLARLALALGAAAPLADGTRPARAPDAPTLESEFATSTAWIDAIELGEAILRRDRLRIADLREREAYVALRVPTSVRVAPDSLRTWAADPAPIVLVDAGDAAALSARRILRALGHPDVRILRGGIVAWIDEVLEPVLPRDTESERARYARVAEVSRAFGGMPRVGEAKTDERRDPTEAIRSLRRGGCF